MSHNRSRRWIANLANLLVAILFGVAALEVLLYTLHILQPAPGAVNSIQSDLLTLPVHSAEQALQANCWRYRGNGKYDVIAAFNDQLPALLARFFARPESKGLSLADIEKRFFEATRQSVKLQQGDDQTLIGTIVPLYCAVGSHDGPTPILYVWDRSGGYWQIGALRRFVDLHWFDDRWIGTVDIAPTSYAPPQQLELWVIARKPDHSWAKIDSLLHTDWDESLEVQFNNGYQMLKASMTTFYTGAAPCQRISQMAGYRNTLYTTTYQYSWAVDHYVLNSQSDPVPSKVIFWLEDAPMPKPLNVPVTPFRDSQGKLLAYHIDQWKSLCDGQPSR